MSRIFILFALLFTTLFAGKGVEDFSFIGVTVGVHSVDIQSIEDPRKETETTFGIRYGQQSLDWRTMFSIAGNKDIQTFSLEIDKILMDNIFGMPEFRPYLGATVGYIHYDSFNADLNNDGLFWGGNLGFIIYATDNIDADISYHFYMAEDMKPLDDLQGGTLSIHYFY